MAAPVLITVYTRINHLKSCVESLQMNDLATETDLFIASDAPSKPEHKEIILQIRDYVRGIQGFKSVNLFAWETNLGSSESIRSARMAIYQTFDTQIFMEDDNVVSPLFLRYMNDALTLYKDKSNVFAVCGFNVNVPIPEDYSFDAYFMNFISANGWATWKEKYFTFLERYQLPDFKSKGYKAFSKHLEKSANNLKRMAKQGATWGDTKITHYMFENQMVCILPCKSLVYNTGWDGTGEHCGKDESYSSLEINISKPVLQFPTDTIIHKGWLNTIRNFSKFPFLGKYKTAIYDWKVERKKRRRYSRTA
jgi:hypothetical protein